LVYIVHHFPAFFIENVASLSACIYSKYFSFRVSFGLNMNMAVSRDAADINNEKCTIAWSFGLHNSLCSQTNGYARGKNLKMTNPVVLSKIIMLNLSKKTIAKNITIRR